LYPILLIFLVFVFFLKVIFSDEIFFLRDFGAYFYPIRHLNLSFIKSFIFPFWNPYIDFGVPFLADLQAQILYPPSIFFVFGFNIGFKMFIIFHFVLSGLGIYVLTRHLGFEKYSSFAASIIYTFSGYLVSSIDILIVFSSYSWLPLIFYFWLKSIDSLKYSLFAGLFLCFQFLGGEPTVFYGTIICLFFHTIYIALFEKIYRIKRFIVVILIGISLSLFQALLFLEFCLSSTRTYFTISEITLYSFAPWEILRLFIPSIFGSPVDETYEICKFFSVQMWLESPYIGIIPLLLLLVSFKERKLLFFIFLLFFSFIISLGKYTPIYDIISSLPFFGLLRYPVKFLFLFTFVCSILIGYSFSVIVEKRFYFKLFFIFTLFFLFGTVFILLFKDAILSFFDVYRGSLFWIDTILKDLFFISLILVFFLFFYYLFKKNLIEKNVFIFGSIFLIVFDLFYFQERLIPTTSAKIYEAKPRIAESIGKQDEIFRVYITPRTRLEFMEPIARTHEECFLKRLIYLMPNLGLMDKVFYASGYRSIVIKDYAQFMWVIEVNPFLPVSHLISLINSKYIISSRPFDEKMLMLKLIFHNGANGPFLYENTSCLPRAFFVSKYKVIKDRIERLEYMLDKLDIENEIVLEEEPKKIQKSEVKSQESRVKITDYQPNKVVIEVDAKSSGFLFLSDTYYPGWKAYIRNQEVKIYKANHCFRAIFMQEGKHIVEFRYIPKIFYIGTVASIFSLLMTICIICLGQKND